MTDTRYNTGNPVGSADPRDRHDNTINLDELVNSTSKTSHPDRLGVQRKTWHGMESEFNVEQVRRESEHVADQASRESEHVADQASRESEHVADQASRETRFNNFMAASGYIGTGTNGAVEGYGAGITLTDYNQIIRDTFGEFWRLSGTTVLPYTTTGGGLPEGGALVGIGDASLRQELAIGVAKIGGQNAQDIADLRGDLIGSDGADFVSFSDNTPGFATSNVKKELTLVKRMQPGDFDLSWIIQRDGSRVVITGDSLSYNRYDFDVTPRANAYDCPPGLMSWSFMLRDFIHRADSCFIHADRLDIVNQTGNWNAATDYTLSFNNRYVTITGSSSSELYFLYNAERSTTNKIILHCSSNPNTSGDAICDVYYSMYPYTTEELSGVLDARPGSRFAGFEPFTFEINTGAHSIHPIKVIFKNFKLRDGSPITSGSNGFILNAVGTKSTEVNLTGRGGWTANQLLADFHNRVGQYNPDLLIMILGANDRYYGTKEQYVSGLLGIINSTYSLNPNCKVICLTAMPSDDEGYSPDGVRNGSTMRDFLESAKLAVVSSGAIWFDNYELFRKIDAGVWRFDNVHLTKFGNKILFDSVVGRFFNGAALDQNMHYYNPLLQAANNRKIPEITGGFGFHGACTFIYDNTTKTYTITSRSGDVAVIKGVYRGVSAHNLTIEFNYSVRGMFGNAPKIGPVSVLHTGSSGVFALARLDYIGGNKVKFFLANITSNSLITDEENNGVSYTVFY